MRRLFKIFAWVAGSLVVLVAVVVAGAYFFVNSEWLRGKAERYAGEAAGRETRIGILSVDWGWTTVVTLGDVRIANADWAERDQMFAADEVALALRIRPLLRGDIVLADLRLAQPQLAVETNAEGVSNWSFSENPGAAAGAEAVSPDERSDMPVIESLDIVDGQVIYVDAPRKLRLDGRIRSAEGEADGQRRIELTAEGELQGLPATVRFVGGSVLQLRDGDQPYPLDLQLSYGETTVTARGELIDPVQFGSGAIDLTMEGPSWSDIFPLLGIPAPPTPPYSLSTNLSRNGDVWRALGLEGRIGESDIAGDITIDYSREKPFLEARLASQNLDFDDLGPLVGAPPRTKGERAWAQQVRAAERLATEKNVFPDHEVQANLLRVMNMDVTYDAARIHGEGLPIQSLSARVLVEDGRAVANPLRLGAAGGVIEGEMALNARQEVPSADARLSFRDLELKEFFRDSEFFEEMGGRFSGDFILGTGSSLAQLMASGTGDAAITMRDGSISGLLVEGAGLDIGEALVLLVTEDARVPIRCGGGRFQIGNGRMTTERVIIDTTDSVVYVQGWINLGAQTLALDLDAQAKDFSLLDLKSTVVVKGKLADPDISLGRGAPIPFLELGDEKDVDCDWLIRHTQVDQQAPSDQVSQSPDRADPNR